MPELAKDGYMTVFTEDPKQDSLFWIPVSDEIGIAFDWSVILQLAAEELVKAMASSLGEAIGKEIARGLFGDNDVYEREILQRLTRIEQQLQRIIAYLETYLPALLDEKIDAGFLNNCKNDLHSAVQQIDEAIARALQAKKEKNKDELAAAVMDIQRWADDISNLGFKLARTGSGFYSFAVEALSAMVRAYHVMATCGFKTRLPGLGAAGSKFRAIAAPWLDASKPGNLVTLLQKLVEEERTAIPIRNAMVGKAEPYTNYVFAVVRGIGGRYNKTYICWGRLRPIKRGDVYDGQCDAWYGEDVELTISDDISTVEQLQRSGILDSTAYKVEIASWFPPRFISWQDRLHKWAVHKEFFERARMYTDHAALHGERIRQTQAAQKGIEALLASCRKLGEFQTRPD